MVERVGLSIPVAYGLDAEETSRTFGCHYDHKDGYIHATGLVADDKGKLVVGCYSTGAIGRLRAENTLSMIRYIKTKNASHLPDD